MAAGIILAGTAEAVILYEGSCRAGEDAAACWLWGNLILLCMFSIETAAYFLAVKKEAGTRLLTWLIVLHYGTFLYAVTETVEKLLEIRVYGSGFRPWSTVSIIIYVIITAITYPFIYRLMKQHRSEHMHTSNRKKLCMVTIISVLLLILYICSLSAEQKLYYFLKDGAGELCILIWMASMILMDIFAYHFYLRGLQTAEKQIEELERTSAMLAAAESQQYQSFSDRLGEDRRMYHNMRHHFRTMASLADRKQYDRLEDYLKRYLKEWEEIADRDICGNPMFNVILGYYFSLAEKKGIRVETDISIKEYYPFDITDMTVLLGNAMENAVEACEDSGADQPFIRIMLRQVKQSFLLNEPETPGAPYNQMSLPRSVVLGGAAGALVALCFLGITALFRKTARNPEEMKKVTSLRCLASIPHVRFKARKKQKNTSIFVWDNKVPYSYRESLRALQIRLEKELKKRSGKILLVTSTSAGEGKSSLAVNLAEMFAERGQEVLLIDGDLRKQADARMLRLRNGFSLADAAKGDKDPEELLRKVHKTSLWFLGGTRPIRQPAPALTSRKTVDFIRKVREKMDYIIIDTPPCEMFQDTGILADQADGILYVVKHDFASQQKIWEGISSLRGRKAAFLGYVFNDYPESVSEYGYGRYGGYGNYGYRKNRYRYGYGQEAPAGEENKDHD